MAATVRPVQRSSAEPRRSEQTQGVEQVEREGFYRGWAMSRRGGWVRACIVGAVLSAAGLVSTGALAQQACCQGGSATGANAWTDGLATSDRWPAEPAANATPLPLKAAPSAPSWWTHGEIEIGGRDFLNDPTRGGSIWGNTAGSPIPGYVYLGQKSLANYYEYSIVAPGAFGGGHVATGSNDGLYQVDLWANNVASNFAGFSDQAYLLQASKIGEQYVSVGWDQTPHVYSTSAQTPYLGVGSNALTLPAGVAQPFSSTGVPPGTGLAFLYPYLHQTDIGIQRDTASVDYRWTPTDAWDIRADYSHMERTGTQVAGVIGFGGGAVNAATHGDVPVQVGAPVSDSTQNFGANGEYLGTSPWGQKYTFKVAYSGSVYTDNISNYTVQNPFGATCATPTTTTAGTTSCPSAQLSTPPSNAANGVGGTLAADLPLQSRYVGTFNYIMMIQNAAFQPMTSNPAAQASPWGVPWNAVNFGFVNQNVGLPTSSLDGEINTLLSNNVITSKITPTLTSKLSYRYYDFDNQTPQIVFPCWVSLDGTGVAPSAGNPCGAAGSFENAISSLSISYIKQDAGAELNWRPVQQWNFNAAYGYERYNYTETDVNITNENSAKLSVDWKPTSWLTARASGYYADRRYDTDDYADFVRSIQFPTSVLGNCCTQTASGGYNSWWYSSAYQQFMFDNRQRTKANFLLDVVAFPSVTITPSVQYKDDYYGLNPLNQYGLSDSKSLSAGVNVGWAVTRDLSIVVSYYWEDYDQSMYNASGDSSRFPAAPLVTTADKTYVNTVTAAVRYAAIPNKLDLDGRYTISDGVDEQICAACTPAYPNDTTLFERVDATATYKLDPTFVRQMGWKGDVKARLRYTWERNSVSNWQNDPLAAFTPTVSDYALWLAYDNPNYTVQMIAASLVATW